MFDFIKGTVHRYWGQGLTIEVNGVGYELQMPLSSLAKLPKTGEEATIFTHLSWKEDGISLYGFDTIESRDAFRMLISVSGVGPKMALSILSILPPHELFSCIINNEIQRLQSIHGIGKKTAARICLDLKDRVKRFLNIAQFMPHIHVHGEIAKDAISALVNLGYRETDASRVVMEVLASDADMDLQGLLMQALRMLSSLNKT
jgi:Holliday junction DNA helicase RuvA